MPKCPECSGEISEGSASCAACGAPVDSSLVPTRLRPDGPARAGEAGKGTGEARGSAGLRGSAGASRSSASTDSIDDARFAPGYVLGGRYRVVGLLGRGGMGEVYRADDLVLKQPVALKLLPEALSGDAEALERFRREVRVARQISHPNVCRVYDIGEAEGLHFLSMEFIRGEELASVLKRFGRLPQAKAAEIARQVCAGVAAAHKGGVLHRDLKPANVMIDEAGEARVTDFGLAALAEEVRGDERAGTPAYMSPEQLAGRELTVRSDIYSLGLVLYELFTGRRAFEARTLPELLRLRESDARPSSPSSLVKDLDPLVERVVLRCLEADPEKRPATALEVAAALPGGDPLAAALALGETPSPEMVAAAPKQGILRPPIAVACLAASVLLLALAVVLSGRAEMSNVMPLEKSPEVLAERGREIAARLGYTERPVDTAEGFFWYDQILSYVKEHDSSPRRWDSVRSGEAPVLLFWYRRSPRYLLPFGRYSVDSGNPPTSIPGETYTALDTLGRLQVFIAAPPQVAEPQGPTAHAPDWSPLFAEAGFDLSKFTAGEPRWTPPRQSDARAAWDGTYPGSLQIPIHVEAASFRGRVVYFDIIYPWDKPSLQESQPSLKQKAENYLFTGLFVLVVLSAVLLARRNVRAGRSDRKGAFNLSLYIFAVSLSAGLLVAHHVPDARAELDILQTHVVWALGAAVIIWIIYLALEPFVRGRWPHRIISWKRLLSGEFRDPLVGRDALVGITLGAAIWLVVRLWRLVPGWLGLPPYQPQTPAPASLQGLRSQTAWLLLSCRNATVDTLTALLLLLLLYVVLRRERLAALALWLIMTLFLSLQFDSLAVDLFFAGSSVALFLFGLMRFGLLAAVFSVLTGSLFLNVPATPNLSAWYAGGTIICLLAVVGLAAYGCYTSLGGQPLFSADLLDRTESGN